MARQCRGIDGLQREGIQDTATQRVDQKLESREEVEGEYGRDDSSRNKRKAIAAMTKVDGAHRRRRCSDGLTAGAAERRAMNEVG